MTQRGIYALALVVMTFSITFFTHAAFGGEVGGGAGAKIFSPDYGGINLYKTLKFEAYKATGTEKEREAAEERMASTEPAAFFIEGVKTIDHRITVLVIGMMFCPDCKAVYPYVEAMEDANPFISTRYLARDHTQGAREFLISRTGRSNVPAIFVVYPEKTNDRWNEKITTKAYVETPGRVTNLLRSAKSERERVNIWSDFHGGDYDEDIQRDLLDLVLGE